MNRESALTRASSLILGVRGFAFPYCIPSMTVRAVLAKGHLGLIKSDFQYVQKTRRQYLHLRALAMMASQSAPGNAKTKELKLKTNNNKIIDAIEVRKKGDLVGNVYHGK